MGLYIGKMDRKWLSRVFIIMLADILGILGSYLLALWARFDFHFMDIPPEFLQGYLSTIQWWVLICLAVFWLCNLYNSIWRFGQRGRADAHHPGLCHPGRAELRVREAVPHCDAPVVLCMGPAVQLLHHRRHPVFLSGRAVSAQPGTRSQKGTENVMIIGAGQAGRQLIREYAVSSHLNSRVACLIDDNPAKRGRILEGVRIVGGRRDIPPGRETVRHPQDHLRHPRPCRGPGGRKF